MSREIKFRDYDMDSKTVRYFDMDSYDRNEHDCYGNIMQYTGLKDKNGKEIYEGDIIVIPIRRILEPCDLGTNEILSVYWSEFGSWNIWNNDTLYDYNLDAEVIGNIYENPELLK